MVAQWSISGEKARSGNAPNAKNGGLTVAPGRAGDGGVRGEHRSRPGPSVPRSDLGLSKSTPLLSAVPHGDEAVREGLWHCRWCRVGTAQRRRYGDGSADAGEPDRLFVGTWQLGIVVLLRAQFVSLTSY